jgi:hypothetical protein
MAFEFDPSLTEKPKRTTLQLSPSVIKHAEQIATERGGKVDEVVEQALRYAFGLNGHSRRKRRSKRGGQGTNITAPAR